MKCSVGCFFGLLCGTLCQFALFDALWEFLLDSQWVSENLRQLVFSRLQDLNDRTVKIPQALGFIISAWILAAG